MNRWMDGWMDGRTDGRTVGWSDAWMGGCALYGWIFGRYVNMKVGIEGVLVYLCFNKPSRGLRP